MDAIKVEVMHVHLFFYNKTNILSLLFSPFHNIIYNLCEGKRCPQSSKSKYFFIVVKAFANSCFNFILNTSLSITLKLFMRFLSLFNYAQFVQSLVEFHIVKNTSSLLLYP